ncbi:MAG TPA: hypothetical protein VK787_07425 [Puia sp.]|jgi:hypothetical protein|nr:hypothetical protein [Puia sp.]
MKNIYLKRISDKINIYQHNASDKLNNRFENYSARKKKMLLISFCILFGSISLCIIINTFYEKSFSKSIPVLSPVSIPYHIGKNFHEPGAIIDESTFIRVEHFKKYLDSLKINNRGRYTEIMNTRPHLMDSIIAFEKIYLLQLKK